MSVRNCICNAFLHLPYGVFGVTNSILKYVFRIVLVNIVFGECALTSWANYWTSFVSFGFVAVCYWMQLSLLWYVVMPSQYHYQHHHQRHHHHGSRCMQLMSFGILLSTFCDNLFGFRIVVCACMCVCMLAIFVLHLFLIGYCQSLSHRSRLHFALFGKPLRISLEMGFLHREIIVTGLGGNVVLFQDWKNKSCIYHFF